MCCTWPLANWQLRWTGSSPVSALTAQHAGLLLRSAPAQVSPNELAPLLGTDTAGMTRLLDRLEAQGARRERNSQDRRSIVIALTGEGRALVLLLPPVFGRVNTRLFAGFADDEVQQVTGMLQRMLENLRSAAPIHQDGAEPQPRRTGAPE